MTTTVATGFHLRTSISITNATGTIGWDWKSGDSDLDLTLSSEVSLSAPVNLRPGCVGRLLIRGAFVVSFGAGYGMTTIQGSAAGPIHLLFRVTATGGIERLGITSASGSAASRAITQSFTHGQSITHNLGSATGLPETGYFLELRGYTADPSEGLITGIKATKTGPDTATIQFLDTSVTVTGTFIFTAIPY